LNLLLDLLGRLGSPQRFGGVVLLNVLLFCAMMFVLFVFVLCFVYPMLPVSLDCPFVIVPSVFFNIYLAVMANKVNNHHTSQIIENKMTMTFVVGNKVGKCGGS
jgi:hypothetical protein